MSRVRIKPAQTVAGRYTAGREITAVKLADTAINATVYSAATGGGTVTFPITSGAEGVFDAYVEPATLDLYTSDDTIDSPERWEAVSGSDLSRLAVIEESPINIEFLEYGAIGDNSTDSYAAIQAALDYAATGTANAGSTVLVPKGIFHISAQLEVPGFVRLVGLDSRASRIRAHSSFPTSTPLVRLGSGSGLVFSSRLEFLSVDCQNIVGSTGVYSNEAQEQSGVFNCTIEEYRSIGIDFAIGASIVGVQDVELGPSQSNSTAGIRFVSVSGQSFVRGVTVNPTGGIGQSPDAIFVDDSHVNIYSFHAEEHDDGIHAASGAVISVIGAAGHASVTNLIHLEAGVICFAVLIVQDGSTNAIVDDGAGITEDATGGPWFGEMRPFFRNQAADRVGMRQMLASGQVADAYQFLDTDNTVLGGHDAKARVILRRQAPPDAPAADLGLLFIQDNGAGKSQLAFRADTGAIVPIATEDPPWSTVASAATIAVPSAASEVFYVSGTTNITSVTASHVGHRVTLVFGGVLTFTDGSNLNLAGNFVTSDGATITLISNGTYWYEVARSVN